MVRVLGQSSFSGVDGGQGIAWSELEKQRYADALNAMLTQWNAAQLEQFEMRLRNGEVNVDFSRPLAFDPVRGLRNTE